MAMAFAGPELPVPEVRDVGTNPSGRAYAISVRHHGRFLEDTPVEQAGAIAPALTRLLVALYRVPADPDAPVVSAARPGPPAGSWQEYLTDGLADDPGKLVHGWSAVLAADPELAALSAAAAGRVRAWMNACPERRNLVHGDLLHGNVLVSPDARRVEAVFSWKCSVRGDFLFDGALPVDFWAPWHPGIAAADPLSGLLPAPTVGPSPAPARRRGPPPLLELHIGFTHLAGTCGPGTRLTSPLRPGVSPRSSTAARCL